MRNHYRGSDPSKIRDVNIVPKWVVPASERKRGVIREAGIAFKATLRPRWKFGPLDGPFTGRYPDEMNSRAIQSDRENSRSAGRDKL